MAKQTAISSSFGSSTPSTDRTREALLLAAKRLFAQNGYDGTSVKELAQLAGVNVSLVSYHFQGKEGLYRACLDQYGRARLAMAERILTPAGSPEEFRVRLGLFIQEMLECHVAEPELSIMVHRECEQSVPRIPDIFEDTFLKVFATLLGFFKAAQKRKIMRPELDAHSTASAVFGGIVHAFKSDALAKKHFGRTIANSKHRTLVADNLVKLLCDGCLL